MKLASRKILTPLNPNERDGSFPWPNSSRSLSYRIVSWLIVRKIANFGVNSETFSNGSNTQDWSSVHLMVQWFPSCQWTSAPLYKSRLWHHSLNEVQDCVETVWGWFGVEVWVSRSCSCHSFVCARLVVLRAVTYVMCSQSVNIPHWNSVESTALARFSFYAM